MGACLDLQLADGPDTSPHPIARHSTSVVQRHAKIFYIEFLYFGLIFHTNRTTLYLTNSKKWSARSSLDPSDIIIIFNKCNSVFRCTLSFPINLTCFYTFGWMSIFIYMNVEKHINVLSFIFFMIWMMLLS